MIIGSNLQFFKNLSSTNSQASLLIKAKKVPEGTVIYTDFQTSGRGQPGSKWESEKGMNLLISIILYPESIRPEDQFFISIAVSLGICDFIDRHIPDGKIKWPNDIYVKDDKIAGILIENTIIGESIESSVAGIGLNINQEKFTDNIPNPVSLKLITNRKHDLDMCLKQLLSDLDIRYKQLLYGDRETMRSEYNSRLYRFKEWHSYKSGDKYLKGRILEASVSGKLIIEEKNGNIRDFSFKEIDYII
jgi:BirA family biotin operon repressor/biotin-[acetyl-CoA-carboxylase] ligase